MAVWVLNFEYPLYDRRRRESAECAQRADELLDALLEGHLAVLMSQHPRLGEASVLSVLDVGVLDIVIRHAFGGGD
jgi:hypothetical protein